MPCFSKSFCSWHNNPPLLIKWFYIQILFHHFCPQSHANPQHIHPLRKAFQFLTTRKTTKYRSVFKHSFSIPIVFQLVQKSVKNVAIYDEKMIPEKESGMPYFPNHSVSIQPCTVLFYIQLPFTQLKKPPDLHDFLLLLFYSYL